MEKVTLYTNLDYIIFPKYESKFLPPIGSYILCSTSNPSRKAKLEVMQLTYDEKGWKAELHIPSLVLERMSVKQWYKQYLGVDI
jgi:hypothetical protein